MEMVDPPTLDEKQSSPLSNEATVVEAPINASGHVQELERNFGIVSLCSLGITSGNAWISLGGTLVISVRTTFRSETDTCYLDSGYL